MRRTLQHFENAAHDLPVAFDRLVGIGIGPDRDHFRLVAVGCQFLLQQGGGVRLRIQLRFEIQPRRQAEIGVGRPRKTIDATVLATPIGVDRAVEADVGRVVTGNDFSRGVDRDRGLEWRQFVEAPPAVVEGGARFDLISAAGIGLRAAPPPPLAIDRDLKLDEGRRGGVCRPGRRRDRWTPAGERRRSAHAWTITCN